MPRTEHDWSAEEQQKKERYARRTEAYQKAYSQLNRLVREALEAKNTLGNFLPDEEVKLSMGRRSIELNLDRELTALRQPNKGKGAILLHRATRATLEALERCGELHAYAAGYETGCTANAAYHRLKSLTDHGYVSRRQETVQEHADRLDNAGSPRVYHRLNARGKALLDMARKDPKLLRVFDEDVPTEEVP